MQPPGGPELLTAPGSSGRRYLHGWGGCYPKLADAHLPDPEHAQVGTLSTVQQRSQWL